MKKNFLVSIGVTALIFAMGSAQAFAMAQTGFPPNHEMERPFDGGRRMRGNMPGNKPEDMPDRQGGFRKDLTDEDKARMEAERLQREEKLQVFIDSLSNEQKVLYDAMTPARREKPTEGQQRIKPDENFMSEMKEKREAFIASLTSEQKALYDELFSWRGFENGMFGMRGEKPEGMPDHHEGFSEKINAFVESLNSEQKALYDAMMPAKMEKPTIDGKMPERPDENFMSGMKEKQEAFVSSLSESQKAIYDELFDKPGRMFGRPGGEYNH